MSEPRIERMERFMSVQSIRHGKEESFEELRVEDYLEAYEKTGKPPTPCSDEPTNDAERAKLGLPPVFKPRLVPVERLVIPSSMQAMAGCGAVGDAVPVERLVIPSSMQAMAGCGAVGDASPIVMSAVMPDVHIFWPIKLDNPYHGMETYQSIVCQPEYHAWSFEELRCATYDNGRKFLPKQVLHEIARKFPQDVPRVISEAAALGVRREVLHDVEVPREILHEDSSCKLLNGSKRPREYDGRPVEGVHGEPTQEVPSERHREVYREPTLEHHQEVPHGDIHETRRTSSDEVLESISCRPDFSRHSFEELRLAYIRAGRTLTSDEIFAYRHVLKI